MNLTCGNVSRITFLNLILQIFSCLGNPVKSVHPAAFRGLLVLAKLRLAHTKLHQLPSLQHIGHSLTSLMIEFSAQLKTIDAGNFNHFRQIKHLRLGCNGLISTPSRLNFIAKTIITLNFERNAINSLTSIEGVKFDKLIRIDLRYDNNIANLRPEFLMMQRVQQLNLVGNHLASLEDVTQFSWGSSLPKHTYMNIHLQRNSWHCNGSLNWIFSNLYKVHNIPESFMLGLLSNPSYTMWTCCFARAQLHAMELRWCLRMLSKVLTLISFPCVTWQVSFIATLC